MQRDRYFYWGFLSIAVLLFALTGRGWGEIPASYTLIPLGDGTALALDKEGLPPVIGGTRVVTTPEFGNIQHAFLLSPEVRDLGVLPEGTFSQLNGLFARQGCGFSATGTFGLLSHPFLLNLDAGGLVDLGTLGNPEAFASCVALTADAQFGFGDDGHLPPPRPTVPLVWHGPGTAQALPTLGGDGFLNAANAAGDACGDSHVTPDRASPTHATCWWIEARQTPVDIQSPLDTDFSIVLDVTEDRHAVGIFDGEAGIEGFIYHPAQQQAVAVTRLPGDTQSTATGINTALDYVGSSRLPDPHGPFFLHQVATIWFHGSQGVPVDLNTLVSNLDGRVLLEALEISNRGAIVVRARRGTPPDDEEEFVVLVPQDDSVVQVPPGDPPGAKPHKPRKHTAQHWARVHPKLQARLALLESRGVEEPEHARKPKGK